MENFGVFRERMKQLLMQLPDAKMESGGNAILLRCRYCGDSKRNKSSRHMYVYLPSVSNPMFFHICYRANCAVKGVVTWQKLIEWGVNLTEEDIRDLVQYTKETMMNNSNNVYFKDSGLNILSNQSINNNYSQIYNYKINYINKRLGTNLTHEDLKKLKISLNLSELIYENDLNPNIEDWKLQAISEKYICFITQDNNYAVCRNTMFKDGERLPMNYRYFKYNIFGNNSKRSLYIIPTEININEPVRIYLSEGTFDILSVKFNVIDDPNGIYCAVLGGGFANAIEYFISDLSLINLEFHLYLDNDMNSYKVKEIVDLIRPYEYNTYIHTNRFQGEKDFGVSKDRIINYTQQVIKGW